MTGKDLYLGVDAGSVSINLVLIDSRYRLIEKLYLRTQGRPIEVLKEEMCIRDSFNPVPNISLY